MKTKSRHAQSQVVGTVLLILIVFVAVIVIVAFIIPFVKNQLSGASCLDVVNEVSIQNNMQYSCYSTPDTMNVQIHIGDIEELIDGFTIELGGASSKSYEIIRDYYPDDVVMYDGGVFELPSKNEERTYSILGVVERPDSVTVYPILKNGKTCDASDFLASVSECFSP